ncbi:acetolactate synthase [Egibacter rhizosphaerae]|uniref:Acetolactate synthase n=1 Tax=Egibacter rhizosphaerae TaxID=1670831 RepID=A0A411YBU2_9ACTN|nr:acetolactate synthase [Egibacter rhizosphaerae]QBI18632.1 acetolactate synthase [Egibacter rhizosphaerae]
MTDEVPSGHLAVRALRAAGIEHLFTLSGGHLFPLYEGARDEGVALVDTRHEQTAGFAAEGLAKLTRRPQVAALTAGPGVTNAMSALASAQSNGSPLVVLGGRAPQATWGRGSLQELDHVAFTEPLCNRAATAQAPGAVAGEVGATLTAAATSPRGPAFLDIPMDVIFTPTSNESIAPWHPPARHPPDDATIAVAAEALAAADRPVVIAGTDVWFAGAEESLQALVETLRAPVAMNGQGRGCVPADHELAISRARGAALKGADLVCVVGAPLDFRLGFGDFGGTPVVHVADHPDEVARHVDLAAGVGGDLAAVLETLTEAAGGPTGERAEARAAWARELADAEGATRAEDRALLESDAVPIHPARVGGELARQLDRDAVLIGDGGDVVSFAGRHIDSHRPGRWLDPGPFGCLGTGTGYGLAARLAHPEAQSALLLGDGAAGFSLMDVDTLVRHDLALPIVVANNGAWALEKHPMRQVYDGWHAAADLRQDTAYDAIVAALGGAGETVTRPDRLAPALERAFAAQVPYLVNVQTDPEAAYPRRAALM